MMKKIIVKCIAAACMLGAMQVSAASRDVQIRSINFETGIVELFNFGPDNEDLDGYRFCTHDEDQVRRYSAADGLNGVTIEANSALFIHFNNDAPIDSNSINISALGAFATPLDSGAYGMQLYFPPVSFGNGNTIADHVQWSIDGVDNTSADDRSDEAQAGGVWTDQSAWVATTAQTTEILLTDNSGAVLHGPTNYVAQTAAPMVAVPVPLWALLVSIIGIVGIVGLQGRSKPNA